jgi:hypothetical protein
MAISTGKTIKLAWSSLLFSGSSILKSVDPMRKAWKGSLTCTLQPIFSTSQGERDGRSNHDLPFLLRDLQYIGLMV